jgi:glucose/arabinose dehydrogenase
VPPPIEGVRRHSPCFAISMMVAAAILAATVLAVLSPDRAGAAAVSPSGFRDEVVLDGLTNPTAVKFSKDGKVFVAEKSGLIRVFDGLSDTAPTTFADLRTEVHNFWDRGLLGLALDPDFPAKPYLYVLYTYDAVPGGTAPRWGASDAVSDPCPDPPGATADGCVVTGRLSRLRANTDTDTVVGDEQVLIEGWCQQYPSHSVGDLAFGADGALYASAGDGSGFYFVDYGQGGGSSASPTPANPCGDPPSGVGGAQTPPSAEGGALRSQDLRTNRDPAGLDGTILRVNPATGDALPTNPLIGQADPNARRVIAYGLRNPFRITVRPGTSEIWLGDVGWSSWEEIDRIVKPTAPSVKNFGWPCYEGAKKQAGYDGAGLSICENLYGGNDAVARPYYTYNHAAKVVPGEPCGTGTSSVTGLAFYKGGPYPSSYDGALFFADYSRNCIWAMSKGTNGLPDPTARETFVAGAATPIALQIGPGGDLFYADFAGGKIHRVRYFEANQPPVARATANPSSGPTPLTVSFDGTASDDPDGDALSYAWDLDGDGEYDDSTEPKPTHSYPAAGTYYVQLKVADGSGASDAIDQPLEIDAGNSPPLATIDSPLPDTTWKVGDKISFSGLATDERDGTLPGSALSWALIVYHCSPDDPSSCHEHPVQSFPGVGTGSFVAPDHEYPSYLELRLTATDSGGLTDAQSVWLEPQTATMDFRTKPTGLRLVVGSIKAKTPFRRTVIVGSKNSISAPSPQRKGTERYRFRRWSDGGARVHEVVAKSADATYTAIYRPYRRR